MAATARRISSTNLRERILPTAIPSNWHRWPAPSIKCWTAWRIRSNESPLLRRHRARPAHAVNNIRGEAEVGLARARTITEYREVLESSLEEAVRLSNLIGDLLFLARAESPLVHVRRESVNIVELLDGMSEYYEASAAEAGVSLTTSANRAPVIAHWTAPWCSAQ